MNKLLSPIVRSRLIVSILLALAWSVSTCGIVRASQNSDAPIPFSSQYWQCQMAKGLDMVAAGLGKLEFFQMLQAINEGRMGPGEGWFHPSASRYGWKWLARKYDRNNNGAIERAELRGRAKHFARLDRDGNGILTAVDFNWSAYSALAQEEARAYLHFRRIDMDGNGRLSPDEWQVFFRQASKGKDYLTPESLKNLLYPPRRLPPKNSKGGGPPKKLLIDGLLKGEIGSPCEGPPLGAMAPDFKLQTQDGAKTFSLSQFRGKKPVALIFGSFT